MNWLRNHPVFDACLAGVLVLGAGFLVVRARSGVAPVDSGLGTWEGSGGVTAQPVYGSRPAQSGRPSGYTPQVDITRAETHDQIPLNAAPAAPIGSGAGGDDFDFDSFVSQLSKSSSKKGAAADNSVPSSYSFVPKGLIASSTPDQSRTEAQEALFGYGNEAGDAIQSFF